MMTGCVGTRLVTAGCGAYGTSYSYLAGSFNGSALAAYTRETGVTQKGIVGLFMSFKAYREAFHITLIIRVHKIHFRPYVKDPWRIPTEEVRSEGKGC